MKTLSKFAIGSVLVAAGISALPATPAIAQTNQSTPYGTFSEICRLAGGSPGRNWSTGRLICRFPDGSTIWCTPSMGRCGHTKALAVSATGSREPAAPSVNPGYGAIS